MGFRIAAVRAEDYDAFARLFPALEVIEPTPSREYFETSIVPGAIFLYDGEHVAGYAWGRIRGERMHVVHVIVDPAHRRKGVGGALMFAIAERARAAGFQKWMLNVKPENLAAQALYESVGMKIAFESVSFRFAWAHLENLELAPSATARLLEPGEEQKFETAFSLPRGEIASYRGFAGRILFACEDAEEPAGVGVFDPKFPGASPFAVGDPKYARTLLTRMKNHALPSHDHLYVFAENNPALATALANAGSPAAMHVLRMEGDIPI
ncbi:MAG: GNAT family N-acetyltransferase [Polyangiaceae bacterium]